MRVLHVIPGVAPRYGGPSEAVIQMVRALRNLGVDASIATTDADGPGLRLAVPLGSESSFRGAPITFFKNWGPESAKVSPMLGTWLVRHVGSFDLVHVHALFSFSSIAAALSCLAHKTPYVVRPLGMLSPWALRQRRFKKQLALAGGGRYILARAAAVHYTTNRERAAAEAIGIKRGVVIPLGVEKSLFGEIRRPSQDAPPYVLVLGRVHPVKNLSLLIEAFARASPHLPSGTRLVIAGDGPPDLVRALQDEARARLVGPLVTFTGWVDGDAKHALVASARLLAMPSAQENFGISAIEALAAGVPVLVTETVDIADLIQHEGCGWVVSCSADAVASALVSALSEPADCRRRGMVGIEVARREFRWEAVAERVVELYSRITSSRERS